MAEVLELLVGGERFSGFRSGQVTQAFDSSLVATTWNVEYASRADERTDPIIIEAGDDVTLRVGDEDLVRGWVETSREAYDAAQDTYTVQGASRVGDLLDCSAVHPGRRFRDTTLFDLATALLDGYGVQIEDRRPWALEDEPIARFAIQEGESIADCLGRAARLRGVTLADVGGDLVLALVGQERTATVIERGVNVLRGERTYSWRQRYSEYRFRGQTRATDDLYGLDAAQIGQTVEDRGVTRLRRLVVHAHTDRREDIGRRAIYERNQRAGRSERLTYELPGWHCAEGLWRPNVLVRVVDERLRVDAELLIVRVTHAFSPNRYRTTLELTRPEAFYELKYPIRARGAAWR